MRRLTTPRASQDGVATEPTLIENVFNQDQKDEMVERVTDAILTVEGESMRPVSWVYIEEVKEGHLAIGGKTLSAADVHRMQFEEVAA
ncbi:MAG: 4-oxalocrotonate tautomerase family protein [Congregibacter sp.]